MLLQARQPQETFVAQAFRLFRANVAGGLGRANQWRRHLGIWVYQRLDVEAVEGSTLFSIMNFLVSFLVSVGLGVWLVSWLSQMLPQPIQDLLLFSFLLVVSVMTIIGIVTGLYIRMLGQAIPFLPFILWPPLYALGQAAIVIAKLLLLIPLAMLVIATRLLQLWRGIFYTCPSRTCAYRGLPMYVCPQCGEGNSRLWPNLYGVLWHDCLKCGTRLPTLALLGRRRLARQCGGCGIPLLGKHAGKAPERLVAIIGGPGSGKTSYLLMAVHQLTNGRGNGAARLRGDIDDPAQAEEFQREWQGLTQGVPAAKTASVARAFLLYVQMRRDRCQLYLYDAPGEEFASLSTMTAQQYFPLLEGAILLVDPCSFASVRARVNGWDGEGIPLQDVVTSTLTTALAGTALGHSGKLPLRIAVVISKADLACVKDQIGDITQQSVTGEACREAIRSWGGGSTLRLLEHRISSVAYFACSPLGRSVDLHNRQPFTGSGILEPLEWLLTRNSDMTPS